MERQVIESIHQVLNKFHISYDDYERYMDAAYTFNLKERDLFVEVFLDMPEIASLDKRERKLLTGSFYTPPDVATLIVEKTLKYYDGDPLRATVLDLSAGTGNLLLAYLEMLQLENDAARSEAIDRLYAYDIQWEPLVVYINRLLLLFDCFPYEQVFHVHHCDALQLEDDRRFDIILGNPPYIGEKGNKEMFRQVKSTSFGGRFYESKMDYHYYFLYKGFEKLNPDGVMGTITTNYHFTADGAKKLRAYIRKYVSYREIVNLSEAALFKDALGQHNVITITQLKKANSETEIQNFGQTFVVREDQLYSNTGYVQIYTAIDDYEILDKIKRSATFLLGDFFEIHQGIVSGADTLSRSKQEKLGNQDLIPGEGIFVLTEEEIAENGLESSSHLRRFYKNSDIDHYRIQGKSEKFILYLDDQVELNREDPEYRHLYRYRPLLEMRREVMSGKRQWYALQWPRLESLFNMEKIVVPHRNRFNRFALTDEPFYASADVYYIIPRSTVFSLKAILAILNSKLMYYWLFNMGKKKGKMLELYSTPLKQIPICYDRELELAECVDRYLETGEEFYRDEMDRLVCDNYGLTVAERENIETFFDRMGTGD